jgi:hypothetical protein
MDVYYFYSYGTAAWLATQAAPLIASPTMIVALLSPEVREASTLEVYFSRVLGFSLITLGILTVLLTGSVPLSSRLSEGTFSLSSSCYPLQIQLTRLQEQRQTPKTLKLPTRSPHSP